MAIPILMITGRNIEVKDIAVRRVSMKRQKAKEIELHKIINGRPLVELVVVVIVIPGLHHQRRLRLGHLQLKPIRSLFG
jgi:hypothetical protein